MATLLGETASKYKSNVVLNCLITAKNQIQVTVVDLDKGPTHPHQIRIDDLTNPNEGGTSNFRIEHRKGVLNVIDYNHAFGQVGIVENPTAIGTFALTRVDNSINLQTSYTFTFTTAVLLPQNGFVTIEFTNDAITSLGLVVQPSFTCTTDLSSSPLCLRIHSQKVLIKVGLCFVYNSAW